MQGTVRIRFDSVQHYNVHRPNRYKYQHEHRHPSNNASGISEK